MRGQMPVGVGRPERTDVMIKGKLRVAGRQLPVTIVDLSDGGCKVRCLQMLPIGEVAELSIPAFQPTAATIRWALPGMAGLRFV